MVVVTADPAKLVAFAIARTAVRDRWDLAAAQTWSLPAT
jgi:hypothetical protein